MPPTAYDGSGNRKTYGEKGVTINYAADGENRYFGSLYDANSNTTNSAVGWTYAYDAEGRMLSTTRQSDGYTISFAYDAENRLVYQSAGALGQPTIFVYAGNQRIEERAAANNASIYRYFHDSPTSDSIVFRQTSSTGARLYYLSDPAGNTTHVANDAGQVVEQYVYDAYGAPMVYTAAGTPVAGNQSTCDNRYLFHGTSAYEWLPSPGLYYCRNRMYLPAHGRWLQPDPAGFAGGDINLYRYCGNDPVNGVDPAGLDDQSVAPIQSYGYDPNTLSVAPGPPPVGTNIPTVTYDDGPNSITDSSWSGQTYDGPSSKTQNAMANGTYEGTGTFDGLTGTFARATLPDGSSPPLPPVTVAVPVGDRGQSRMALR